MTFSDVLQELDILTIDQTRFYSSIILVILHYLHQHYIIYRDLKPDNLICDLNGYLKLVDMGTAKILNSNEGTSKDSNSDHLERTFTRIGTPEYMAPEVTNEMGMGYSYSSDYWSLGIPVFYEGIVIYEIACGSVPFGYDEMDPSKIPECILNEPLVFPEDVKDESLISLVSLLLNKSPESRLNMTSTELMTHDFFANVNWNELMNRQMEPPYIPEKVHIEAEKRAGTKFREEFQVR